jgi:hypothetical protein
MRNFPWCAALVLSVCASSTATAHDAVEKSGRIHAAIGAVFPDSQFSIRGGNEGDMDGDGVNDYAAIVVLSGAKDGRQEERLVVFSGALDGGYKPISVSGQFCEPDKFYNISMEKNALIVQAVSYADASRAESVTRKFRYNAKISDFELIGREELSVGYDENSSYSVSVNYLTKVVRYSRHLGKSYIKRSTTADGGEKIVDYSRRSGKHKEIKAQFENSTIFRLQGFDCGGNSAPDTGVYIDENFKVHTRTVAP